MENLEVGSDTIERAKIPECLGEGDCEILKIHNDGDLTVSCRGSKYVVTTDGDVFKEFPTRPKNWGEITQNLVSRVPPEKQGGLSELLENVADAIIKARDG